MEEAIVHLKYRYGEDEVNRGYRFSKVASTRMYWNISILFGAALICGLLEKFHVSASERQALAYTVCKHVFIVLTAIMITAIIILKALPYLLLKYTSIFDGEFSVDFYKDHFDVVQKGMRLTKRNKVSESKKKVDWSYYKHKAENDEFIFLIRNRSRSFIPKRVFANEDEYNRFIDLLNQQSHIKEAFLLGFDWRLKRVEIPKY